MNRYCAAVFSDLEQHSVVWGQTPREKMVAIIAEYRYLAESLAGQYGCLHNNFTGDGHLFLFATADPAVRFALKLIPRWRRWLEAAETKTAIPPIPLRLGCHFGECMRLEGGEDWVGKAIVLAKRVEDSAEPDTVYVTENVLELLDLPLYVFEAAGTHSLKGDHLPERPLYRIMSIDESGIADKPVEELSAEGWFLKAISLIESGQGNSEQEASCYREALRLRPDYPEAHNNLAVTLRAMDAEADAAEHYREALRLRPDYPDAHYNYAILLEARGGIAGALNHYNEALRLRPDYVEAHHSLANLMRTKGELNEAKRHYSEALRLRPNHSEVHNNLAVFLEDVGEPAEAESHYKTALEIRPDYPEAHYNYALLLESKGQSEVARSHYRQAIELRPHYPEAHNNLAILLHMSGDLAAAQGHYEAALRLRPNDPEAHYNYALLLRTRGQQEAANEHFKIASDLAPETPAFRSQIDP